ncbi:hypothetical protein OF83DRAFT_1089756, partial [Amylostereum chailletii]
MPRPNRHQRPVPLPNPPHVLRTSTIGDFETLSATAPITLPHTSRTSDELTTSIHPSGPNATSEVSMGDSNKNGVANEDPVAAMQGGSPPPDPTPPAPSATKPTTSEPTAPGRAPIQETEIASLLQDAAFLAAPPQTLHVEHAPTPDASEEPLAKKARRDLRPLALTEEVINQILADAQYIASTSRQPPAAATTTLVVPGPSYTPTPPNGWISPYFSTKLGPMKALRRSLIAKWLGAVNPVICHIYGQSGMQNQEEAVIAIRHLLQLDGIHAKVSPPDEDDPSPSVFDQPDGFLIHDITADDKQSLLDRFILSH